MNAQTPMKYKDLTAYSQTIGAVTISGIPVQLCDYVESLDGAWYATAYLNEVGPHDRDILSNVGVIIKTLPGQGKAQGMSLAYVPLALLERSIPQHDDEHQTENLIMRLHRELSKLNMAARVAPLRA